MFNGPPVFRLPIHHWLSTQSAHWDSKCKSVSSIGSFEYDCGVLCANYCLYFACYRVAVGPFKGLGCERSELPCPGLGSGNLGRRSWSFLSPSVLWTMVMPYCAHYRLHLACNRVAVAGGVHAVVSAIQAVACTMHYEHVPIHRLDIRKFLSQAAQEVKPEASSLSNPWSSLRSGVTRG